MVREQFRKELEATNIPLPTEFAVRFGLVGDDVRSPFGIEPLVQKWTRYLVPYNARRGLCSPHVVP
jgi:hypothetical protein